MINIAMIEFRLGQITSRECSMKRYRCCRICNLDVQDCLGYTTSSCSRTWTVGRRGAGAARAAGGRRSAGRFSQPTLIYFNIGHIID